MLFSSFCKCCPNAVNENKSSTFEIANSSKIITASPHKRIPKAINSQKTISKPSFTIITVNFNEHKIKSNSIESISHLNLNDSSITSSLNITKDSKKPKKKKTVILDAISKLRFSYEDDKDPNNNISNKNNETSPMILKQQVKKLPIIHQDDFEYETHAKTVKKVKDNNNCFDKKNNHPNQAITDQAYSGNKLGNQLPCKLKDYCSNSNLAATRSIKEYNYSTEFDSNIYQTQKSKTNWDQLLWNRSLYEIRIAKDFEKMVFTDSDSLYNKRNDICLSPSIRKIKKLVLEDEVGTLFNNHKVIIDHMGLVNSKKIKNGYTFFGLNNKEIKDKSIDYDLKNSYLEKIDSLSNIQFAIYYDNYSQKYFIYLLKEKHKEGIFLSTKIKEYSFMNKQLFQVDQTFLYIVPNLEKNNINVAVYDEESDIPKKYSFKNDGAIRIGGKNADISLSKQPNNQEIQCVLSYDQTKHIWCITDTSIHTEMRNDEGIWAIINHKSAIEANGFFKLGNDVFNASFIY